MNIGSGQGYPASALSNFSPHPFEFFGTKVNSMEGFLQSLKFKSPEMAEHVCSLVGYAAKKKGKHKNWKVDQTLYWMGNPIKRDSAEYQSLLDEAYQAMYDQSESFRKALVASGNSTLTHTMGKTMKAEHRLSSKKSELYGDYGMKGYDSTERFPRSVQVFASDKQKRKSHSTQTPIALVEYFIRTYTNEGETVLDTCSGSETTGLACINTGRKGILIEIDPLKVKSIKKEIYGRKG